MIVTKKQKANQIESIVTAFKARSIKLGSLAKKHEWVVDNQDQHRIMGMLGDKLFLVSALNVKNKPVTSVIDVTEVNSKLISRFYIDMGLTVEEEMVANKDNYMWYAVEQMMMESMMGLSDPTEPLALFNKTGEFKYTKQGA